MRKKSDHMNESGMSEAEVDETLEASFPASDPPSWTLGIDTHSAGARNRKCEDKDELPTFTEER
jgi:hypothetical protein